MSSRQTGRRPGERRGRRQGGVRQMRQDRTATSSWGGRQVLRLVICGGIFVLLVAVKLLLPDHMARLNETLTQAMGRNMDVQAVFSAVGRAFAGESDVNSAAGEVYRAVFFPNEAVEVLETAVPVPTIQENAAALTTLQAYLPSEGEAVEPTASAEAEETGASSVAYVLYTDQNLPENVRMEQVVLGFDYCTPVNGTVSSDFGYREHPIQGEERFHYGVDLAADTGTEIRCFADGTVTAVGESSSYGNYCIVAHAGGYSTLYAHCSRVTATSGATVTEGEKIAEVGETGMATGPHLHFELQQNSTYFDPIYYVT